MAFCASSNRLSRLRRHIGYLRVRLAEARAALARLRLRLARRDHDRELSRPPVPRYVLDDGYAKVESLLRAKKRRCFFEESA